MEALLRKLALAALVIGSPGLAVGQMMPGGQGMGRPSGMSQIPGSEIQPSVVNDKPDAAARKAYAAAMKSLNKAKEYGSAADAAPNADKKSKDLEKMGDAYNRALDQFTEALSNDSGMVEAWSNVGYIHLKLGAYAEAIDDYDHTLALQADFPDATLHRAEACLEVDRLEDAKAAYMDLFNHESAGAGELLAEMQAWLKSRSADPHGMRIADVNAFGKWVTERDAIAHQAATPTH